MITKLGRFDRALTPSLKQQMLAAAREEGGWLREVLADKGLVLALRGDSANVYYCGQSLFRLTAGSAGLQATTHEKYLFDPKLKGQIKFDGRAFDVAALRGKALLDTWKPGKSLARMKTAAALYAGDEKIGCHRVAIENADVIDVEIALSGTIESADDEPGKDVTTPRIDLLVLKPGAAGGVQLAFWEAKLFENPELGSGWAGAALDQVDAAHSPVLAQIANYRLMLEAYGEQVVESYQRVCRDLLDVWEAAGQADRVGPLTRRVAGVDGPAATLSMGTPPEVNLFVFKFGLAQRKFWHPYRKKLEAALAPARLYAKGVPKGARL